MLLITLLYLITTIITKTSDIQSLVIVIFVISGLGGYKIIKIKKEE
jgi:hypothetical protein